MNASTVTLGEALVAVAPGTALRGGLERIQHSRIGTLIVLGHAPETGALCSDGFDLDVAFTTSRLRELCKMDDTIVLDTDKWRIRRVNIQLLPDPSIPTSKSDIRHRTARRTAHRTYFPILSLSVSIWMTSTYAGEYHRLVEGPEALLARTNLAVNTLDHYSRRLDKILQILTVLEVHGSATARDVTTVLQHAEVVRRIVSGIDSYLEEPGSKGRLLILQANDLIRGSASERALVMRNYVRNQFSIAAVEQHPSRLSGDKLADLTAIASIPGLGVFEVVGLDRKTQPREIRTLSFAPHLPWNIIKDVSSHQEGYTELRAATIEDLQGIEGIGPYRAKLIHESLEHQAQMAANDLVG